MRNDSASSDLLKISIFRKIQDEEESCRPISDESYVPLHDWSTDENARLMIQDCFVTGDWKESEDAETLLRQVCFKIFQNIRHSNLPLKRMMIFTETLKILNQRTKMRKMMRMRKMKMRKMNL